MNETTENTEANDNPTAAANLSTQSEGLNLYQRVSAVMSEVKYVKKDATVRAGGGSYKGVSHDAVTAALRPALVRHGLALEVDQISEETSEGVTANGRAKVRYSGWYSVSLINVDNPTERSTVKVHAHADDSGDKAPGKAVSYAVKTALLKAFCLETGENDESRYADAEVSYVTPQQAQQLHGMLHEVNADLPAFLSFFGAPSVEKLQASQFEAAHGMLAQKLRRANQ